MLEGKELSLIGTFSLLLWPVAKEEEHETITHTY